MAAQPAHAAPAARPSPRQRPHARRPHLRVVGAPRRGRRWALVLSTLIVAGLLAVVGLNALVAEAAVEAAALDSEIAELSLVRAELGAEVAALESPERIAQVARDELGLVWATDPAYIVIDPGAGASGTPVAIDGGR